MNKLTIYTHEELKKIQKIELEALKEFIRVCNLLNLEYFVDGGTAIGAIRHQGFIPWDDDVDVAMPRLDYQKFCKEAPKYLSKEFYLQTPYSDKKCPYFYSKLRVNGTEFVEYCNHKVNMNHGIYIDIYPFDEVPDDEAENIKQFKKMQFLTRLFTLHQSPDVNTAPSSITERIKALIRFVAHMMIKCIPYSVLAKQIEKTMTQYNGSNQHALACIYSPKRNWDYIPRDRMYPLIDIKFEDITVKILNDYDFYLTNLYGDYMKFPPENERYGHKPWKITV